jgi:hypothetical protein
MREKETILQKLNFIIFSGVKIIFVLCKYFCATHYIAFGITQTKALPDGCQAALTLSLM